MSNLSDFYGGTASITSDNQQQLVDRIMLWLQSKHEIENKIKKKKKRKKEKKLKDTEK